MGASPFVGCAGHGEGVGDNAATLTRRNNIELGLKINNYCKIVTDILCTNGLMKGIVPYCRGRGLNRLKGE